MRKYFPKIRDMEMVNIDQCEKNTSYSKNLSPKHTASENKILTRYIFTYIL